MAKGFALYDAVEGYGYAVIIYIKNNSAIGSAPVASFRGGDHWMDSTIFCAGDLTLKALTGHARLKAKYMLAEHGLGGATKHDAAILAAERKKLIGFKAVPKKIAFVICDKAMIGRFKGAKP
jgi:hypothetical protein